MVLCFKVVEGMDVIFKIEQTKTDSDDKPTVPIVISESGTLKLEKSYTISDDPYRQVFEKKL